MAYVIAGLVMYGTGYMSQVTKREQWEREHPGMSWDAWKRRNDDDNDQQ